MNILNPSNSWAAQNLPDGLSLQNGVISGSLSVKGNFSIPVTVSNPLGSDTKNISIVSKYRPGFEKFSILQDGVEVDKLTIPELQAMVQDGTAQQRFNCTNTQMIIPVLSPALKYAQMTNKPYNINNIWDTHFFEQTFYDVPLNFCSFRNVTLQDGTVRPALILQFASALWPSYAPFDTGDSVDSTPFNRWRYSNLRQWLNSEGKNWFVPAYDGDALVTYMDLAIAHNTKKVGDSSWDKIYNEQDIQSILDINGWVASYADYDSIGFLDLLPDDLHSILQPIKIVTQAFFDTQNENTSIEDPEDIDGVDADITYDKVFLPSFDEMYLYHSSYTNNSFYLGKNVGAWSLPSNDPMIEGTAWEYYRNLFGTDEPFQTHNNDNEGYSDWGYSDQNDKIAAWGQFLPFNITLDMTTNHDLVYPQGINIKNPSDLAWVTRSANILATSGIWGLGKDYDLTILRWFQLYDHDSGYFDFASPAPAFAIC